MSGKRNGLVHGVVAIIFVFVASCNQPSSPTIQYRQMAESMADMECRAISIREQRFALANEIRFAQDTLLREKSPIKIARLKTKLALLNTQKEVIYQQSMKTADSIKAQLDSLQEKQLTDSTARRSFSEALKSALKERGCGE